MHNLKRKIIKSNFFIEKTMIALQSTPLASFANDQLLTLMFAALVQKYAKCFFSIFSFSQVLDIFNCSKNRLFFYT